MSDTDLRDFYRRYVAAANTRDFDRMDEFIGDEPAYYGEVRTREATVESLKAIIDAVPDFHWEVTDLLIMGNRLAARLINTGTPVKEWLGVTPTGRSFEITEYAVYEIQDGRFAYMSNVHDVEELERQLAA
ncbi:ester cyclase [Mycobacterium sp. ITM-2016-00317]|uniref:ester cyclase n=1 Tax=Mycobacterium sp. ITM-2016-00317 TaxID=2099694 RepID=UPI000D46AD98|nr:ester cyclase [Mycobacterium sp. ITM-2016-00317]WNG87378.1 ester cyclase [Mycobacterium sp. ITM-2016-00317]